METKNAPPGGLDWLLEFHDDSGLEIDKVVGFFGGQLPVPYSIVDIATVDMERINSYIAPRSRYCAADIHGFYAKEHNRVVVLRDLGRETKFGKTATLRTLVHEEAHASGAHADRLLAWMPVLEEAFASSVEAVYARQFDNVRGSFDLRYPGLGTVEIPAQYVDIGMDGQWQVKTASLAGYALTLLDALSAPKRGKPQLAEAIRRFRDTGEGTDNLMAIINRLDAGNSRREGLLPILESLQMNNPEPGLNEDRLFEEAVRLSRAKNGFLSIVKEVGGVILGR